MTWHDFGDIIFPLVLGSTFKYSKVLYEFEGGGRSLVFKEQTRVCFKASGVPSVSPLLSKEQVKTF